MQALGLVWGEVDSRAADFHGIDERIEGPRHPGARLTYQVWQERMAAGGFVVGRDIPSRALSSVLRNIAVYEPIGGGDDFRVRIAGTAFFRRFGRDVTGRRLSELFLPDLFAKIHGRMTEMLETGEPCSVAVEHSQGSRQPLKFEILCVPVTAPDRAERWVLKGMFFEDWVR